MAHYDFRFNGIEAQGPGSIVARCPRAVGAPAPTRYGARGRAQTATPREGTAVPAPGAGLGHPAIDRYRICRPSTDCTCARATRSSRASPGPACGPTWPSAPDARERALLRAQDRRASGHPLAGAQRRSHDQDPDPRRCPVHDGILVPSHRESTFKPPDQSSCCKESPRIIDKGSYDRQPARTRGATSKGR